MSTSRAFLRRSARVIVAAATMLLATPSFAHTQAEARIRDHTTAEGAMRVRLMGYGLVIGRDGTGDRAMDGQTTGQSVQSVGNILRRFDMKVKPNLLRMRNVAAVLVTAETSPYLRAGGRFEIQVASMGDACSVRGGVLYNMTPLVADPGGLPRATAQGPRLVSEDGSATRSAPTIGTSARIPSGDFLEADLPRPTRPASSARLFLREPDLGTTTRIVAAINGRMSGNVASIEDEGSVQLTLPAGAERAAALARVLELAVRPDVKPRLVLDDKDGTVFVRGDIAAGPATVKMRESVPQQKGIVSGGGGEEFSTALMEQHLAAETPQHWERRLSDALYRQLSQHLVTAPPTDDAATDAAHPDSVRQPHL